MNTSYWRGERVTLRAIELSDWEVVFGWNHDDEMARRLYWVPFPQSREAVRRWAEKMATREPDDDTFHFAIENHDSEVVGSISTHDCDRRNGTFAYGLNVRAAHRRKGYGAEAIEIVLRYYFLELRYQKVTVEVYGFNTPSIALHERLGFQREGCLRRTVYTDGRYHDTLMFGLTFEEFAARHGANSPT